MRKELSPDEMVGMLLDRQEEIERLLLPGEGVRVDREVNSVVLVERVPGFKPQRDEDFDDSIVGQRSFRTPHMLETFLVRRNKGRVGGVV